MRIPGEISFRGRCPGDDLGAFGMSAVGDFIEISHVLACLGFMDQTECSTRPVGWLGSANGGVGQLPTRIKTRRFLTAEGHAREYIALWICKPALTRYREYFAGHRELETAGSTERPSVPDQTFVAVEVAADQIIGRESCFSLDQNSLRFSQATPSSSPGCIRPTDPGFRSFWKQEHEGLSNCRGLIPSLGLRNHLEYYGLPFDAEPPAPDCN